MSAARPARCSKVRYANAAMANEALDRIDAKRPRWGKLPVRAYRCPVCKGWHLTSSATGYERRNHSPEDRP